MKVFFIEHDNEETANFFGYLQSVPYLQYQLHVFYNSRKFKRLSTGIDTALWLHSYKTITDSSNALATQLSIRFYEYLKNEYQNGDEIYIVSRDEDKYEELIEYAKQKHCIPFKNISYIKLKPGSKLRLIDLEPDKDKKCEICQILFASSLPFNKRGHDDKVHNFKCPECCKSFYFVDQLQEHLKNPIRSVVVCDICETYFRDVRFCFKTDLQEHIKKNHPTCKCCGNHHFDDEAVKSHEMRIMKHKCLECKERFVTKEDLTKHMKQQHPLSPYCVSCHIGFKSFQDLKTHNFGFHNKSDWALL